MSNNPLNHADMLKKKHAAIEAELHEAGKAPAADEAKIAQLKREKLAIKDKLNEL